MRTSVTFYAAMGAAVMVLAFWSTSHGQTAKPALYTSDQAQAGATVFANACASCHGAQLEGVSAPALKGPPLGDMANAQGLTVQALLEVTATSMPQSDPGSLKPEEYNAVVAYILQQNGYPAGKAMLMLGAAGLKDTKVTP